ncbi:hypothetical protein PR048_028703 [Dryococelus australis]|uniref:Uncharacterized protein n=1 Tax=Dryococelus australis TaxID=614101 RepID=A0ABQ9GBB0_9NEOP|nr:hypothetical protein PR048_028703 [Dryococelus australis]
MQQKQPLAILEYTRGSALACATVTVVRERVRLEDGDTPLRRQTHHNFHLQCTPYSCIRERHLEHTTDAAETATCNSGIHSGQRNTLRMQQKQPLAILEYTRGSALACVTVTVVRERVRFDTPLRRQTHHNFHLQCTPYSCIRERHLEHTTDAAETATCNSGIHSGQRKHNRNNYYGHSMKISSCAPGLISVVDASGLDFRGIAHVGIEPAAYSGQRRNKMVSVQHILGGRAGHVASLISIQWAGSCPRNVRYLMTAAARRTHTHTHNADTGTLLPGSHAADKSRNHGEKEKPERSTSEAVLGATLGRALNVRSPLRARQLNRRAISLIDLPRLWYNNKDKGMLRAPMVTVYKCVEGPRRCSGQATHLPLRRTGFDSRRGRSRIFAFRHRSGRCCWSVSFLGDLPFSPLLHSGVTPYSPHVTLPSRPRPNSTTPALPYPELYYEHWMETEDFSNYLFSAIRVTRAAKQNADEPAESRKRCESSQFPVVFPPSARNFPSLRSENGEKGEEGGRRVALLNTNLHEQPAGRAMETSSTEHFIHRQTSGLSELDFTNPVQPKLLGKHGIASYTYTHTHYLYLTRSRARSHALTPPLFRQRVVSTTRLDHDHRVCGDENLFRGAASGHARGYKCRTEKANIKELPPAFSSPGGKNHPGVQPATIEHVTSRRKCITTHCCDPNPATGRRARRGGCLCLGAAHHLGCATGTERRGGTNTEMWARKRLFPNETFVYFHFHGQPQIKILSQSHRYGIFTAAAVPDIPQHRKHVTVVLLPDTSTGWAECREALTATADRPRSRGTRASTTETLRRYRRATFSRRYPTGGAGPNATCDESLGRLFPLYGRRAITTRSLFRHRGVASPSSPIHYGLFMLKGLPTCSCQENHADGKDDIVTRIKCSVAATRRVLNLQCSVLVLQYQSAITWNTYVFFSKVKIGEARFTVSSKTRILRMLQSNSSASSAGILKKFASGHFNYSTNTRLLDALGE